MGAWSARRSSRFMGSSPDSAAYHEGATARRAVCYTARAIPSKGGGHGGDGEDGGVPRGGEAVRDPRVPGAGPGAGGDAHQGRARQRVWLGPPLLGGELDYAKMGRPLPLNT